MKNKIRVWPVIHLQNEELAILNAKMAQNAGAYGVFVIQMNGYDEAVIPIALAIRDACPTLKIGVNLLSMSPSDSLIHAHDATLDAMWSDRPGVTSVGLDDSGMLLRQSYQTRQNIQVFASVAFKYQAPELRPIDAILNAHLEGWIPTTSGVGTGQAPDPEWVKMLRSGIGDIPLALASGMDPDNVIEFSPYLTDILVATGISESFHRFCPNLLKEFMAQITETYDL